MPLLRYRTGDLTRIIPEPCPCGRSHLRIDRIKGRADDMLLSMVLTSSPSRLNGRLWDPGVGKNYVIEIRKENYMDRLYVKVKWIKKSSMVRYPDLRSCSAGSPMTSGAELSVSPVVELVEPSSLPVWEGKAKRVIDRRGE